jgi:leader peptidase (prepilin peptidase)/N-methyltransferase
MEWWFYVPAGLWCLVVFLFGLAIGSFLNVLIARLPLEKSIFWPAGSRCFSCFQPIRLTDNLPIIGYLRLRGRCRRCGATFSSRYLWIELGTGLGFLALFVVEVLLNWHHIPALNFNIQAGPTAAPPWSAVAMFLYHAFLLSCLIAAAAIDAEHRIIPPMIPYAGVLVGVVGGALMPWPWPNPPGAGHLPPPPGLPPGVPWSLPELWGKVPEGVQPWPFYGPTFAFAPPGSWQLGLLNSVLGAFIGSLVVRLIKVLFEVGFGREAMGLGDADLLMMTGAFLGWQIAVLSLFVGALTALVMKVAAILLLDEGAPPDPNAPPVGGIPQDSRELPFGPGLAVGVVVTWFAWPWLGPAVQYVFFDWIAFGLGLFVMCVGVLAAGLLLRRPDEAEPPAAGGKV